MQLQTIEIAERVTLAGGYSAERQLWCAVVGRALQDALDQIATIPAPAERQKIREDARDWFVSNGREFRIACESAGYDPDYLRTRILSLIAAAAA
ncbi:MAG TPA: hypothetical protein VFC38_04310 [Stellaceae bacterium]|nr:hypothetical protein [Stellaceae bacterium]